MRKFEFGLEAVLRYQRQLERMAELKELAARGAVAAARARLAAAEAKLERLAADMVRQPAAANAAEWPWRFALSAALAVEAEAAHANLQRAESELAIALADRAKRGAEAEALAVVRRERLAEHRRDVQRHEQRRLDELSLRRHARPTDE